MSKNKIQVPEAKQAMEQFKMEAANEVGVNLKQGYNGDLTAKQAGSIGGQMVKKKIADYENRMKKDILKVECDIDMLDLDVLAFIDHNITVNVIKNGEIVEKKVLVLPKQIKNVIKCRNPRCITSIEQGLPHVFVLSDEKKEIYRCKYCEEKYSES